MRGTVSALGAQATAEFAYTGLVAAGTWTRSVGLYDFARGGECVSTWNVAEAASSSVPIDPPPCSSSETPRRRVSREPVAPGIGGTGINQTIWSPCGRYLLINERQSSGMLIYDARVTNKVLGFLAGRDALTNQRLSCDVFQGLDTVGGFEVWAGTSSATVKVWEGVGNTEGCQWPSWDFPASDPGVGTQATDSPALGSVALHHSGSVVATCSGCWSIPDDDDDDYDDNDDEVDSETDSSSTPSSYQSFKEPGDNGSSVSSRSRSRSPSILPGLRSGGRRFEESTLKIWKIGPVAQVDEKVHIHGTEA